MKSLSILVSTAIVAFSLASISLVNPAFAASDLVSRQVVAVCGSNGAAQIIDADKVPVRCHVSTVNSPPASRGSKYRTKIEGIVESHPD
jgi:hypothetical protein